MVKTTFWRYNSTGTESHETWKVIFFFNPQPGLGGLIDRQDKEEVGGAHLTVRVISLKRAR